MIEVKSNELTKAIAVTFKAYMLAKNECEARKAKGYSSSVSAIASEAIVEKFGDVR